MRILSRYVLRRYLGSFAGTLVILLLGVTIVELLIHVDDVFGASGGLLGALARFVLRTPLQYLPYLIPIASFAAAFLSLGVAARGLEVVAVKAGGISPLRLAVPILVAAGLLAGATLALTEALANHAAPGWRRTDAPASTPRVTYRRGSFWYHTGSALFNVRSADPEHGRLAGVTVFELDATGRLRRELVAPEASVAEDGTWLLRDVSVRTFDPNAPDLPPKLERARDTRLSLQTDPSRALLQADVASLSIRELREYLRESSAGPGVRRARALLHQRLTDPLSVWLFVLLAVPLALRVEQTRTLAWPALQGVITLFLFYTVREYGATLAFEGIAPVAAAFWSVPGLFVTLGAWQLARAPR